MVSDKTVDHKACRQEHSGEGVGRDGVAKRRGELGRAFEEARCRTHGSGCGNSSGKRCEDGQRKTAGRGAEGDVEIRQAGKKEIEPDRSLFTDPGDDVALARGRVRGRVRELVDEEYGRYEERHGHACVKGGPTEASGLDVVRAHDRQ